MHRTAHKIRVSERPESDTEINIPQWIDVYNAGAIRKVSYYPHGFEGYAGHPCYIVEVENVTPIVVKAETAAPEFLRDYGHTPTKAPSVDSEGSGSAEG